MDAHIPDEFFERAKSLLLPHRPSGPRGGRPRLPRAIILRVLRDVLVTGIRWLRVPTSLGAPGRTA
jgi:transposase